MARAKGLIPERDNPIARWPSARLVPPPFRNRQGGNKGCLRLVPPRSGYLSGGIPTTGGFTGRFSRAQSPRDRAHPRHRGAGAALEESEMIGGVSSRAGT